MRETIALALTRHDCSRVGLTATLLLACLPVGMSVAAASPQSDPRWLAKHAEALHRQGQHEAGELLLQRLGQRFSDDLSVLVTRARLAARRGETQYALALLQEGIRLDSRYAEAWMARAEVLRQQNRISEAMQDLETALRLNPPPELAERMRGLLRLMQGQWEAAILHLTRYLNQSDGEDADAFCWRGLAWLRFGRPENAEPDFARALQLHPNLPEVWQLRAQALESQGKLEEAATAYQRCVQLAPHDQVSRLAYAKVLHRLHRYAECLAQLEAVVQLQPRHREALQLLLQTATTLRRPHVMLAAIERLLEIEADPNLWFRKARTLEMLFREREALEALAECERLSAAQSASNARGQLSPLFYAVRARLLMKLDRYQDALAAVQEATKRSPQYAYAFYLRADIHWRMGRTEEALADLNIAEQLQPDDVYIFIKRAELLRSQGKWEAALKQLDRAVAINPKANFAMTQRGGMLLLLGKWEEALQQFAQVRDDGDEHLSTLAYAQAVVAALQGNWEQAERIAEEHFAGFPTDALSSYNMACAWAIFAQLRIQKFGIPPHDAQTQLYQRRALDLLEKTFALGYKDRWHTRYDPDLFVLHREPAFWRLAGETAPPLTKP